MFLLALSEGAEVVMSEAFASPLNIRFAIGFVARLGAHPAACQSQTYPFQSHEFAVPRCRSAHRGGRRVRNQVRTSGRNLSSGS